MEQFLAVKGIKALGNQLTADKLETTEFIRTVAV